MMETVTKYDFGVKDHDNDGKLTPEEFASDVCVHFAITC